MKFTRTHLCFIILSFLLKGCPLSYSQEIIQVSNSKINVVDTLPEVLKENSGMFIYDNRVYFINDSRNKACIYCWDITLGDINREIKVKNAFNIDWEDADADDKTVCIGDIGNNFGIRKRLKLLTFPIELLSDTLVRKVKVEKYRYKYAEKKKRQLDKNANPYDAEALIVDRDSITVFTKDRLNYSTSIYSLNMEENRRVSILNKSGSIKANGLITGACLNKKTGTIALVGYNSQSPFILLRNKSNPTFLLLQLLPLKGYALESICFWDDTILLVSSEKGLRPAVLFKVDISEVVE